MSRPRQDSPRAVPAEQASFQPGTPSLSPIFADTIRYIDAVLRAVRAISGLHRGSENAASQYPFLTRLSNLQGQLEKSLVEVGDIRRTPFSGMEVVFKRPQVDTLRELQIILKRVNQAADSFCDVLQHNLQDPNAPQCRYAFEEQYIGLDHRASQTLTLYLRRASGHRISPLCRLSLELIEGQNEGVVNYIPTRDLSKPEKQRIEDQGGASLIWKCPDCQFCTKYYFRKAANANIEHTEDILQQDNGVARYRAVFLAKSHLRKNARQHGKYGCIVCLAGGCENPKEYSFRTEAGLIRHATSCSHLSLIPQLFRKKLHIAYQSTHDDSDRFDLKLLNR